MKKPIKPPAIDQTEAEVFIIETLSVKDQIAERYEGRILSDILKLCDKKPAYVYCRTKVELEEAADMFRLSGYRFLHVSAHGSSDAIFTTLEEIPNKEFAEIFKGKLRNRRVFFSACEVGSGTLNLLVQGGNKGMYSIACPIDAIRFDHAAATWAAFYVRMFQLDSGGMKGTEVERTLQHMCRMFGIRFSWSWYRPKEDSWGQKELKGN